MFRIQSIEYWYDVAGTNLHENLSCMYPCSAKIVNDTCLHEAELGFSEDSVSVFVPTYISTRNRAGMIQNFLLPTSELIAVQLSNVHKVPILSWYNPSSSKDRWSWHSSHHDTTINVIDKDGNINSSFSPGSAIVLSVSDLLQLAGLVSLDETEPLAGRNHLPDASTMRNGPSRRLSGMELHVDVNCATGNVCQLTVQRSPATWITASIPFMLQNVSASRKYRGIRIKTALSGEAQVVDLHELFVGIASSTVFFKFPPVIYVTALFLCGHLSTIYRNVVYKNFSITKEAGAMAMRLLEHEVAFSELEATSDVQTGGDISRAFIEDILKHITSLRSNVLDPDERQQMVDFCVSTVTHEFRRSDEKAADGTRLFFTEACDGLNIFSKTCVKHLAWPMVLNSLPVLAWISTNLQVPVLLRNQLVLMVF